MGNTEDFLQDYGELFKNIGSGETSGKIFALLMAGEKPEMTLDELSEELGRSKSTIHSAVKKLLADGIITYKMDDDEPSEGRYQHLYHLNANFWEGRLKQLDAVSIFKKLLLDTVQHLKELDEEDPRIQPLGELAHMYSWFEQKLPEMFKEYEKVRMAKFGK